MNRNKYCYPLFGQYLGPSTPAVGFQQPMADSNGFILSSLGGPEGFQVGTNIWGDPQRGGGDEGLFVLSQSFATNFDTFAGNAIPAVTNHNTVRATAAGVTNLWTNPGGALLVVVGFSISVVGSLAVAGSLEISLYVDDALGELLWTGNAYVGATVAQETIFPMVEFGAVGRRLPLDSNLVVDLSAALTAGSVAVSVWGAEVQLF